MRLNYIEKYILTYFKNELSIMNKSEILEVKAEFRNCKSIVKCMNYEKPKLTHKMLISDLRLDVEKESHCTHLNM